MKWVHLPSASTGASQCDLINKVRQQLGLINDRQTAVSGKEVRGRNCRSSLVKAVEKKERVRESSEAERWRLQSQRKAQEGPMTPVLCKRQDLGKKPGRLGDQ